MALIELGGVTKSFGDLDAVDDIDLSIDAGEVFGFLGPNGAGKSTTINLMLDFIRPTSGSIEVFGMDAQEHSARVRRRVGVLPEGYGFEDPLTGREYVNWAIATKNAEDDPDDLLETVGLAEESDRLAKSYSKGMQQRLSFAMALVDDPELLILDEPSTGLDPNGIQQLREVVRERAAGGTTVFFSSHHLAEVEAVCDRVGVMSEGELVAVGSIDGLRESAGGHATIRLECATDPATDGADRAPAASVVDLDGVADATVDGRTLTVTCLDSTVKADVVTHVSERVDVTDVLSESVSLESLFNELTEGGRDRTDGREDGATREVSS